MKCLYVAPGIEPAVRDMVNKLEYLHDAVGGYIQAVPMEPGVVLICNEKGKLQHLLFNRFLRDKRNQVYDWIAGNFLVVGDDGNGEFCSLDEDQLQKYQKKFSLVQKHRR